MLTNKITGFSADLLNTVRGVLEEAKKCPADCKCEKCEAEDEKEEAKEGYESHAQRKAVWANRADDGAGHPDKKKKMKSEGHVPTADEPTDANKKTAQKIRDMMAKEKKPVKEESEELDEISKATMGRYINKAKDSIDMTSYRQGHRDSRTAFSGNTEAGKAAERKLSKRHKGIETAVKKLTKEDAEQIDEISKATLGSYIKKASGAEQPKNVMSPKNVPLTKIAAYQGDSETGHFGKRFNQATYDKAERLRKNRETGIKTAVKKLTKEDAEQIDELSKDTMGRYINKAATKIGSQGVTAGLKIAADEKSSKNFKDMGKREKGIKLAVSKLTKEEQDFIDSLNDADMEQIDELSGATLGSYVTKSKKDETARKERGIAVRDEIRKKTGLNVGTPIDRKLYSPTASRGAGQKTALKKLTGQARVNAKEEVELDEARGRPRKAGAKDFTIHPKTKEKLMHNNPADMAKIERLQKNKVLEKPKVEAGQHIMNQLSKAKTSMTGGTTINFTHGDSKHVSGTHAAKLLDKYAGMKPNEKEAFQKKIGHSHENLMKEV